MDEIHPHLSDLWAALVLSGAQTYGVRLDQRHSEGTRVAFEGASTDAPTSTADGRPLAQVSRGYCGKEDPRRKQVTVSLSVSADGALPAGYQLTRVGVQATALVVE